MNKINMSVLFAAFITLQAQAQLSQDEVVRSQAGFHLIVKFKNNQLHHKLLSTPETNKELLALAQDPEARQKFATRHHISANPVDPATILQPLVSATGLQLAHSRSASLGYDELAVKTDNLEKTIQTLMATGQFVSVEPVYLYHEATLEVNDPLAKDQFYLRPYAVRYKSSSDFHALHTSINNKLGRKVRFAVLDSGSWEHEDVQFAEGYNFVNAESEPGRGRGPDTNAKYTREDGTSCQSTHGLNVASIIGASKNNNVGMVGAFPSDQAEIVPVRVLGCINGGTVDVMEGLLWAAGAEVTGVPTIAQRVDVANLSLGRVSVTGCGKYEQDIFNRVAKLGVTVVVAAGNEYIPASGYAPAACGNVITVGALTNAGDKANFSNYGTAVDVAAEGNSVYIASFNDDGVNSYANGSGTSFAAPLVSALAGAMIAQEPALTGEQIEARLKAAAIKNPSKNMNSNCRRYGCGAGLIQVKSSMGLEPGTGDTTYSVQHRYEGLATPADLAWMTALQPKATACQTFRYNMGVSGIAQAGVSYKVYLSQAGGAPDFLKEIALPQLIYATPDNATLSFQRCQNGSCSALVAMHKNMIEKPVVCR